MARTASGSSASAPSPYTVSVGKATRPPRRSKPAAASKPGLRGQRHLAPDPPPEAHPRERHGEPALAGVVRGADEPGADQRAPRSLPLLLQIEMERRRRPCGAAMEPLEILAPAEVPASGS